MLALCHCKGLVAFKDWKLQVPVIESRGMIFTHYRKPGMLLGDFYLLGKANFWQSPKDSWLELLFGKLHIITMYLGADMGSMHICGQENSSKVSRNPQWVNCRQNQNNQYSLLFTCIKQYRAVSCVNIRGPKYKLSPF